jgi:hypothetical protein
MKRLKIFAIILLLAAAVLVASKPAQASEGTANLTSPTAENASCFISSVLLENRNYKLIVSCRDLIYPPSQDLFSYILWTTPAEGGNAIKLGELGVGKAEFNTNRAFSELFVTSEPDNRVRSPSDRVIMRGSIEPLNFEGKVEAAQAPPEEKEEPAESFGEIIEEPTPTPTPIPQQPGVLGGIRRAGIIALAIFFVIILAIAAITRSRG